MKKLPDWFYSAFNRNFWGWWHSLSGALIALILTPVWPSWIVFNFVFFIAILWEWAEYELETYKFKKLTNPIYPDWRVKVYGSKERWLHDSFGDVILACVHCLIIILSHHGVMGSLVDRFQGHLCVVVGWGC